MELIKTGRQIGRTIRNASRLREIVGVFAKHGFHKIAEKVRLGRFVLDRLNTSAEVSKFTVAERLRMSFEELGPSFVKLGQLLASRPDLVPEDLVQEFSKLHDSAQPLPFEIIEGVLQQEFGAQLSTYFASFDPLPLGSASIAQVHRARLVSGQDVVVKVQRPQIVEKINDDLNILYMLAELLVKYVPETRPFNPIAIVDEYFKTLELETNFVVEANNIRRFRQNFAMEPNIVIPEVYFQLTTERVLTMEALSGIPLSQSASLKQEGVIANVVVKLVLRAYMKMVFLDGFFHGDLHAGNFFILPNNQIGLIDFGIVGRLNQSTKNSIVDMLIALSKEDYEQMAHEFVALSPYSDKINVDLFAKDLTDLLAPYYGLTMRNVNLGRILLTSGSVAAKNGITVPAELMLFFKSIVCVEGLVQKIQKDFDFLSYAIEFSRELIKERLDPKKIVSDVLQFGKDSRSLVADFPRQFSYLMRKWNSPNYASKFQVENLWELRSAIEKSFRLLFLAILISALLLSAAFVLAHPTLEQIGGMPTFSFFAIILAALLSFVAMINYFRS